MMLRLLDYLAERFVGEDDDDDDDDDDYNVGIPRSGSDDCASDRNGGGSALDCASDRNEGGSALKYHHLEREEQRQFRGKNHM